MKISYVIYIFRCINSLIMAVGESNVREEIKNCISMHVVLVDVGFLKNSKIKFI